MKYEDFIIYGYKNSEGEHYANKNKFKFIEYERPSNIKGDADMNEMADIVDATNIQKVLAQLLNLDGSVPYDSSNPINP